MASPQSWRYGMSPGSGRAELTSPLSDEAIWKRLRDSGFDEETIKRRDKAALIAYISKLEAEIYDHQHHMGLLILERKEWASKYQEIKDSAEAAELKHKCDLSTQASALAEAKKREESLKRALRVEKECITNLEKALHEMRTESAETKVAAESKLAEAHILEEDALKKFSEAEARLHAAEALEVDAKRYHSTAERKMQEVEAREDDLRRRIMTYKSECDAAEKELTLERQALSERQKTIQQEQEQLLDAKTLLNQREEQIFNKSQELYRIEKEMENSKENIEKELRALNVEKSDVGHMKAALSAREEELVKKEALLNKREKDLLILQEKLAIKDHEDTQKLKADHENALKKRMIEFDAELEKKLKSVENEIENKRRDWELREVELNQRQDSIAEKEHELESQSRALQDKEFDIMEKLNVVEVKEEKLSNLAKEIKLKEDLLKKEVEQVANMKGEIKKSLELLEERKKQIDMAEDHLVAMKSESSELLALEMKLKEEIDVVRSGKSELMVREEELKLEKAKFEAEWEAIDEKRLELQREAERIAEERISISKFLKEERDMLKAEKESIREEHKRNVESLSREREDFLNKMVTDRAELFNTIEQERTNFLLDIEMQKRELENCIEERREELETQFRHKENAFEQEMRREHDAINSLHENVKIELENVAAEMKRLEAERLEIKQDRERRDIEWAELINSIEELKVQRQKLKEQRESLHADKEEIFDQIESLKKLEQLKIAAEKIAEAENERFSVQFRQQTVVASGTMEQQTPLQNVGISSQQKRDALQVMLPGDSPDPAPLSWIKRCANLIFKQSPQPSQPMTGVEPMKFPTEYAGLKFSANLTDRFDDQMVEKQEHGQTMFQQPDILRIFSEESGEIAEVPHVVFAGSKRKNNQSSSQDMMDLRADEGQPKKRKQEKVIGENTLQPVQQCLISAKASMLVSVDQDQGTNEVGDVVVIDKMIKVTEVSCTDTENIAHGKLDDLESSMLDGNSSCTENVGVKATEHTIEQNGGGIISDKIDDIIAVTKDEGIIYPDKEKKVEVRTRSRQKM
uniref:Protein CROWDED NUCLEI 4-like n=1 Tax=Kalanchoe fedtschenkoi TaxID=63787 RepID=A0A7N0UQ51_KALFE